MKKINSSERWRFFSYICITGVFVFGVICAEYVPLWGGLLLLCILVTSLAIYFDESEKKDRHINRLEQKNKCFMYTTTEFTKKIKKVLYTYSNSGAINLTADEIDNLTVVIDISQGLPVYMIFQDYSDRLPDFIHDEIETIWNEGI